MPFFILGMNIAKPQIAAVAVDRCTKITTWLARRYSLTRAVGNLFVFRLPEHPCTSCCDCTLFLLRAASSARRHTRIKNFAYLLA